MIYSPLYKRISFCLSIYVMKVMKLVAFIYNDGIEVVKTLKVQDNIQIASVCGSIKPTELVTAISRLNLTDSNKTFLIHSQGRKLQNFI